MIKKILLTFFVTLVLGGGASANDINQLNKKLLEIETKFDVCLNTKDKLVCEDVIFENPILEILGNERFGQLLSSSDCAIGTKCGATNARILSKTMKVTNLVMDLD
jgi:hypothetical protein